MKGKVDILDLVEIAVVRLPPATPQDLAPLAIEIVPYDDTKRVILDEDELSALNNILTDRSQDLGLDPRNPQDLSYLQEFVAKWLSEMYRNGLAELENVPEGAVDHYHKQRKWQRPT